MSAVFSPFVPRLHKQEAAQQKQISHNQNVHQQPIHATNDHHWLLLSKFKIATLPCIPFSGTNIAVKSPKAFRPPTNSELEISSPSSIAVTLFLFEEKKTIWHVK